MERRNGLATRRYLTLRKPRSAAKNTRESGFTVVELLLASFIMVLILAAVGGLLVSSTRAYGVTEERSEAIQDSEAVMQLLRSEIGLAGYRGLDDDYDRPFTLGDSDTLEVERTAGGDEVTIRYYEDRFLAAGDSGERTVTFSVDAASQALVRREVRPGAVESTELLVGSVGSMTITHVVDRGRTSTSVADILSGAATAPSDLGGLRVLVNFSDGQDWEFLVSTMNPQTYSVSQ